jgi:hypothetical protein
MQGAKVFFAQSHPTLSAFSRPKIARQAAHKALAMVVDLDKLLIALFAAPAHRPRFRISLRRYSSTESPPRMTVSCSSV